MKLSVQAADFDAGAEIRSIAQAHAGIGGIASFVGLVRDNNEGASVGALTLEHYPGMTEKSIQRIMDEATGRWALIECTVIHRIGRLMPKEQIVLVVAAAAHRGAAFEACEFIMDYLKTRAPFWKKEQTAQGERWVEARSSDDEAAARWGKT